MDLRAHCVDALVLRAIPYGEADAVVHLLVRGRGRISAFARGARSSRKRFGGALEPFQRVEALVAEREGQELWALREARVVEGHARLREDLHRIAHAGYAAELIHDLTRAGQPADGLFALLEEFLTRLEAGAATSARLRALELLALEAAGFAPELAACARCGSEGPPGRAGLDPGPRGGVCGGCTQPRPPPAPSPGSPPAPPPPRAGRPPPAGRPAPAPRCRPPAPAPPPPARSFPACRRRARTRRNRRLRGRRARRPRRSAR